MLGALALIVTVQSGQTLSGIAASHGVSLSSVEAANPQISNPDYIYVGEHVRIGGSTWSPSYTPSHTTSTPGGSSSSSGSSHSSSSGSGSSTGTASGYHIPGVSDSTAACIARTESTNGAGSANVFQISNYYPGMSLAQQEAAAGQIAASQGVHSAWGVYDGCA